jgi:hypothetical protein
MRKDILMMTSVRRPKCIFLNNQKFFMYNVTVFRDRPERKPSLMFNGYGNDARIASKRLRLSSLRTALRFKAKRSPNRLTKQAS